LFRLGGWLVSLAIVAACESVAPVPIAQPVPSAPTLETSPSPRNVDSAIAASFAFLLDSLEPTEREVILDEFSAAIGPRLDGLSNQAAELQLLLLASNGKFRLDDGTLLRRLDLETKAMLAVDTSLCAQLARGELQFGKSSPALAALMTPLAPSERLEEARIVVGSIRAEVMDVGEPNRFPRDQAADLAHAMLATFSPEEAARLANLAGRAARGEKLADADACDVSRIPYRAAASLSAADRLRLARYILGR
jgi:hypothetical protein